MPVKKKKRPLAEVKPAVTTRALRRTKDREPLQDDFEVEYDLGKYPLSGPLTMVRVMLGITTNCGDCNFIKAEIAVEAPCHSSRAAIKSTKGRLSKLIASMLEEDIQTAKDSL